MRRDHEETIDKLLHKGWIKGFHYLVCDFLIAKKKGFLGHHVLLSTTINLRELGKKRSRNLNLVLDHHWSHEPTKITVIFNAVVGRTIVRRFHILLELSKNKCSYLPQEELDARRGSVDPLSAVPFLDFSHEVSRSSLQLVDGF